MRIASRPYRAECRHGTLEVLRIEPLAKERLTTLACEEIQRQATADRPERGHQRVVDHPVLVLRRQLDDQEVVDFGERQEGRIQKCDDEQARAAERNRDVLDPRDESPPFVPKCRLRSALATTTPHPDEAGGELRAPIIAPRPSSDGRTGHDEDRYSENVKRWAARLIALATLLVGSAAAIYYSRAGLALSHYDARAHLVVARRIFDSLMPGWQQIGAVWLPFPHVLNMVPVQVDAWYRTGASAIAISRDRHGGRRMGARVAHHPSDGIGRRRRSRRGAPCREPERPLSPEHADDRTVVVRNDAARGGAHRESGWIAARRPGRGRRGSRSSPRA